MCFTFGTTRESKKLLNILINLLPKLVTLSIFDLTKLSRLKKKKGLCKEQIETLILVYFLFFLSIKH